MKKNDQTNYVRYGELSRIKGITTVIKADVAGKQDNLTPAQMAAVDSGITAEILSKLLDGLFTVTEYQSGQWALKVNILAKDADGVQHPIDGLFTDGFLSAGGFSSGGGGGGGTTVSWDDKGSQYGNLFIEGVSVASLSKHGHTHSQYMLANLKGVANGVAELDSAGKIPTSQLPSYVSDVIEKDTKPQFPATGEANTIYIAKDTNLTYRWTGSAYVEISPSIALGETSETAYRGDRGKTAYDHSQITNGNPHGVTFANIGGTLAASQVPNLAASKITSGTFADDRIASASTWNAKYSKPSTGIPKTDLASVVQTSLGLADTALQSHQAIYALTIQKNGTTVGVYTPNASAKTINITDVASATTLQNLINKIDDLFTKESYTDGGVTKYRIKANYGLYSETFISAGGFSSDGGGSEGSMVSWSQLVTSGTKIATITIDGVPTNVYAPATATWDNISGKPSWIGDSKPSYAFSEITGTASAAQIPSLDWSKITTGKPTTLSGYGITDAKIVNGVITLGSSTITPLTSHQSLAGLGASLGAASNALTLKNQSGTVLSTITAANLVTVLGNTAVNRAISDGDGNNIASTYVTLATAQTISGAKTFSSLLAANNGARIMSAGSNAWLDVGGVSATTDYIHIFVSGASIPTGRPLVLQNGYGNVGIGVVAPTEKLEVSGNVKATIFKGSLDGNAASATKLATARNIWGQSFNGTAAISGDMSSVGKITFTAKTSKATSGNVLEVVTINGINYLHTTLPFFSDEAVSAGEIGTGGGGGTDVSWTNGDANYGVLTIAGNAHNVSILGHTHPQYMLASVKGAANGVAELGSDSKIPMSQLPDIVMGQLMYGGTVNASNVATLSANVKTKLGISSSTVTLTNGTGTYGYTKFEGVYFIMSADSSFASLDLKVGDWMISTGTAWKKIDNTDAVTGVKGQNQTSYQVGNVNISWDNVKPSAGVAKAELASGVQTSLGLADGALQKERFNVLSKQSGSSLATCDDLIGTCGIFRMGSKADSETPDAGGYGNLLSMFVPNADTYAQLYLGYYNDSSRNIFFRTGSTTSTASAHRTWHHVLHDGNFVAGTDYLTPSGTAANASKLENHSASYFAGVSLGNVFTSDNYFRSKVILGDSGSSPYLVGGDAEPLTIHGINGITIENDTTDDYGLSVNTPAYFDSTITVADEVTAIGFKVGSETGFLKANGTVDDTIVTSGGNVGIGTASPSTKLHVAGAIKTTDSLTITKNTAKVRLETASAPSNYYLDISIAYAAAHSISIVGTYNTELFGMYRSHLCAIPSTSGANFGIGTTAPSYKLHVNGTAGFSDNVTLLTNQKALNVTIDSTAIAAISTTASALMFGRGTSAAGISSYFYGDNLYFKYGNNVGVGMTLANTGRVGVGLGNVTPGTTLDVLSSDFYAVSIRRNNANNGAMIRFENTNTSTPKLAAFGYYKSTDINEFRWYHYTAAQGTETIATLTSTGNFIAIGQVTVGAASDLRFKKNIESMSRVNAESILAGLRPVEFDWNELGTELSGNKGHDTGLIAQEVCSVFPHAVSPIYERYLRVDYAKLTPILVAGWQSHETRIEKLERENMELKEEIKRLRA